MLLKFARQLGIIVKKMKFRYYILLVVVSIAMYLILNPVYFDSKVRKYEGDGQIENISWRFYTFPINGYSISFDSFGLSKSFSKTYNLKNLPDTGETSFYLAFEDSQRHYLKDSNKSNLKATVKLVIKVLPIVKTKNRVF